MTPAHQCPTGVVLAPERRHALCLGRASVDGVIIEDDYDAEFRYDRQPVGSLQGLAPDRVIAMGSVSKTLAPALRLGWMVVPAGACGAGRSRRSCWPAGARPALDQLALAALIESGRFDKHLRRMRTVYGGRRRALVEALASTPRGSSSTGLAAGCHAVLRLPAGAVEPPWWPRRRDRGVRVYGIDAATASAADPEARPALVLGLRQRRPSAAIRRGIERIADLVRP